MFVLARVLPSTGTYSLSNHNPPPNDSPAACNAAVFSHGACFLISCCFSRRVWMAKARSYLFHERTKQKDSCGTVLSYCVRQTWDRWAIATYSATASSSWPQASRTSAKQLRHLTTRNESGSIRSYRGIQNRWKSGLFLEQHALQKLKVFFVFSSSIFHLPTNLNR